MASNIDASTLDLQERVVAINRVSKTVKGGRVMKFSALVVVGNGDGIVGFGIGKAAEVPDAIRKGIEDAKKHLTRIAMRGTTIPHDIMGEVWRRPRHPEARRPRYRRYRRRPCACRGGVRWHPRYPRKGPALQQPLQRSPRHPGRPYPAAHR